MPEDKFTTDPYDSLGNTNPEDVSEYFFGAVKDDGQTVWACNASTVGGVLKLAEVLEMNAIELRDHARTHMSADGSGLDQQPDDPEWGIR